MEQKWGLILCQASVKDGARRPSNGIDSECEDLSNPWSPGFTDNLDNCIR